jgi:hypothetical protein
MACPFFLPIEKLADGAWLHPGRLPLGCGWSGKCNAPGYEGENPSIEELQNFCNLGYANGCPRLPRDRPWDSVRFGARMAGSVSNGGAGVLRVHYVFERAHLPAGNGLLECHVMDEERRWNRRHENNCVQRMAECFVESYLEKLNRKEAEGAPTESPTSDC